MDAGCRNLTAPWVRDRAQSCASVELCGYFEDMDNAGPAVRPAAARAPLQPGSPLGHPPWPPRAAVPNSPPQLSSVAGVLYARSAAHCIADVRGFQRPRTQPMEAAAVVGDACRRRGGRGPHGVAGAGPQARLEAGVYTLHDMRVLCGKADKHWCPYYLARHMIAFANVVVYNYQYMLDPKVQPAAPRPAPAPSPASLPLQYPGASCAGTPGWPRRRMQAGCACCNIMQLLRAMFRSSFPNFPDAAVVRVACAFNRQGNLGGAICIGCASAARVAPLTAQVSQMVSRELEKECIVVFDEAHNIDNVCIEVGAARLQPAPPLPAVTSAALGSSRRAPPQALSVNLRQQTLESANRNLSKLNTAIERVKATDAQARPPPAPAPRQLHAILPRGAPRAVPAAALPVCRSCPDRVPHPCSRRRLVFESVRTAGVGALKGGGAGWGAEADAGVQAAGVGVPGAGRAPGGRGVARSTRASRRHPERGGGPPPLPAAPPGPPALAWPSISPTQPTAAASGEPPAAQVPGNIRRAEHFVAFLRRFVAYLRQRMGVSQVPPPPRPLRCCVWQAVGVRRAGGGPLPAQVESSTTDAFLAHMQTQVNIDGEPSPPALPPSLCASRALGARGSPARAT